MTLEEDKKIYENLDFKSITKKVQDSMIDIISVSGPEEGYTLFHKVKERFTHDELAFVVNVHVAEGLRDILANLKKNPEALTDFLKNNI